MENYFGIAAEEERTCLKESHFICLQLDVMGIQISALGKWWSLFQFVINRFGVCMFFWNEFDRPIVIFRSI